MKGRKVTKSRKKRKVYMTKKRKKQLRKKKILKAVYCLFLLIILVSLIVLFWPKKDNNNFKEDNDDDVKEIKEEETYIEGTEPLPSKMSYTGNINGSIYFLNVQDKNNISNQSILIRSYNDKYALIDTGSSSCTTLLDKIKNITGDKIKIEYLILSNSKEHNIKCADYLLSQKDVNIKKIYMKKVNQSFQKNNYYEEIIDKYKDKIIYVNNFIDGTMKQLGTTKLYFYNNSDIFDNSKCNDKIHILKFKSTFNEKDLAMTTNSKYIYIDNPNDDSIHYTDIVITTRKRYYAVSYIKNNCNENANSIALLVAVPTSLGNKYIYLPNELENNGYPYFGTYNNTIKKDIYGSGTTYGYKVDSNGKYIIDNNELVPDSNKLIKKTSEYWVSTKIKNKLGEDINDIVIYSSSNHGFNNSKESIEILNLNRNSLITVNNLLYRANNTNDALLNKTYLYTLDKSHFAHSGNNNLYFHILTNGKIINHGKLDK